MASVFIEGTNNMHTLSWGNKMGKGPKNEIKCVKFHNSFVKIYKKRQIFSKRNFYPLL